MSKLQDENNQINIQIPNNSYSPPEPQKLAPKPIQEFKLYMESNIIPSGDVASISQDILTNIFIPGFLVSIKAYIPTLLKLVIILLFISTFWLLWQFAELRMFLAFRLFLSSIGVLLGYV